MTNQLKTSQRIKNAHPSTRRVIRGIGLWTALSLILSVVAASMTALAPLGILVHPPVWFVVLAQITALAMGLTAGYVYAYITPNMGRLRLWATAGWGATLLFGLTVSTLIWAGPVISTFYAPTPSTQTVTVTGVSDLARPRFGCRTSAKFGTLLAPSGSICMDRISPHVRTGWTFALDGTGHGWATRITRFDGMR